MTTLRTWWKEIALVVIMIAVVGMSLISRNNKTTPVALAPTNKSAPTPTPVDLDDAILQILITDGFMQMDPAREFNEKPGLMQHFVSTGEFGTIKMTDDTGAIAATIDVVYAYMVNQLDELLVVPVTLGVEFTTGEYFSFSPPIDEVVQKEEYLSEMHTALYRGNMMLTSMFSQISSNAQYNLNWSQEKCETNIYPSQICIVGELLETQYPGLDYLLTTGLAHQNAIEPGWVLWGRVISSLTPENASEFKINLPASQIGE
jgi:hypothetical protein